MLHVIPVLLQLAAVQPVDASLVGMELLRPTRASQDAPITWYNRVRVEVRNDTAATRDMTVCPQDAQVELYRSGSKGWKVADRYRAFALAKPSGSGWARQCQRVSLSPGQRQHVDFIVRGVPGRLHSGQDVVYGVRLQVDGRRITFLDLASG